ncbi:MAG: lactate utilization protein [Aigarchaeota archaeon]|nr:lactate utilization protein [Aigarchaeota archaeon]MDW7986555.1 LUD domain-containing protein [Nitrososphaerota archaeon]
MATDNVRLFIERLESIGAVAYVCKDVDELIKYLYDLTREVKTPILVVGSKTEYREEIISKLKERQLEIQSIEQGLKCDIYTSELSIGFPEKGIASTGTVIYRASSGIEEAALYAPEKHISIISRSRLHYELDDVEEFVENTLEEGESIFFITGPSSTADIEGEIVRGVHGPRIIYTFILDNY